MSRSPSYGKSKQKFKNLIPKLRLELLPNYHLKNQKPTETNVSQSQSINAPNGSQIHHSIPATQSVLQNTNQTSSSKIAAIAQAYSGSLVPSNPFHDGSSNPFGYSQSSFQNSSASKLVKK